MAEPAGAALDVRIRVRRGDFSLDVELHCPSGITCIMGPSGSGKSTILAAVAGLATPDEGRIALGDEVWFAKDRPGPVRKGTAVVPTHERSLAYVFQNLALFPHMTALGNVEYGMHAMARPLRRPRAQQLLDRVGVGHLAHRRPRTFSGGEAQRVALARALARSPRLVLLDEPFSALDRDLRAQLTSLVRELVPELGVPIVHVTHSVAEARQLGDQIIRIEKGRIVARGAPGEVLANLTSLEE